MMSKTSKPLSFFESFPHVERTDVGRVVQSVAEQYRLPRTDFVASQVIYLRIMRVLLGLGVVDPSHTFDRGRFSSLRFLDLACGTDKVFRDNRSDHFLLRAMEPWLCRTMAFLGADVTGVDFYHPRYLRLRKKGRPVEKPFIEPEWRFVQRDLLRIGALDRGTFPDDSYGFVNSSAFIGCEDFDPDANDPNVESIRKNDPEHYRSIVEDIMAQVRRMLSDGGVARIGIKQVGRNNGVFDERNII